MEMIIILMHDQGVSHAQYTKGTLIRLNLSIVSKKAESGKNILS